MLKSLGLILALLFTASLISAQSVPLPVITPIAGQFTNSVTVSITDSMAGVDIYYTLDGSTPTTASVHYAGPITVISTATVRAIAVFNPVSPVAAVAYTITLPAPPPNPCQTSTSSFVSVNLSAVQNGNFRLELDATPSGAPTDSVIGLGSGVVTDYTQLAVIGRFGLSGSIEARSGANYITSTDKYVAGQKYHFVFDVTLANHTFNFNVTNPNGTISNIGTNLAFRSEQSGLNSFSTITLITDSGTKSMSVCNVVASPLVVATPPKAFNVTLTWNPVTVAGITGYNTYSFDSKSNSFTKLAALSTTSYMVQNVPSGTTPCYSVTSVAGSSESPKAPVVCPVIP